MEVVSVLIKLISGAVGGNVVGTLFKNLNLGVLGNSLAGVVGGGLGGMILGAITGSDAAAATTGAMDVSSIISSIAGGGVGGGVLMAIVGYIRKTMGKTPA